MLEEANRKRLPDTRPSITYHGTHRHATGQDQDFYVTVGFYDDPGHRCDPGEVFIVIAKEGDFIRKSLNAFATMASISLQFGCPWGKIRDKFLRGDESDMFSSIVRGVDRCIELRAEIIGEE